jgi:ATP-dependent RNA helicase DDX55/SPB4
MHMMDNAVRIDDWCACTSMARSRFDAPQDPNVCVHRIGRTARMGKEGSALLFLSPAESTYTGMPSPLFTIDCIWPRDSPRAFDGIYPALLSGRKVPIAEYELDPEAPDVLSRIRDKCLVTRELMEKAQIAFVSYIRAYKEHQCKYIFPFKQLHLGRLATSFSLLKVCKRPAIARFDCTDLTDARTVVRIVFDRACVWQMPKMPELKGREHEATEHFTPADIDLKAVPYSDKKREKARKAKLAKQPTLEYAVYYTQYDRQQRIQGGDTDACIAETSSERQNECVHVWIASHGASPRATPRSESAKKQRSRKRRSARS